MIRFLVLLYLISASFLLEMVFGGELGSEPPSCRRVITLSPALGRVVLDLIGEKEFSKVVVGISAFSELETVSQVPEVASVGYLQIERILSLKPDCIFEAPGVLQKERVGRLREMIQKAHMKVRVWSVSMDRLSDIPKAYRQVGLLLKKETNAERLLKIFEDRLKKLSGRLQGMRVLVQVDDEPLIVLGGGATFLQEAIQHLGAENVFAGISEAYPRVSLEAARASRPAEIWILGTPRQASRFLKMEESWKQRFPQWEPVRNKRLKVILSQALTLPTLGFLDGLEGVLDHGEP